MPITVQQDLASRDWVFHHDARAIPASFLQGRGNQMKLGNLLVIRFSDHLALNKILAWILRGDNWKLLYSIFPVEANILHLHFEQALV